MEVCVIGVKTEQSGNDLDDKKGIIIEKIVPLDERGEYEPKYREMYRSNLRVQNFEIEEPKKWFLMTKENDAYLWGVLSWSHDKDLLDSTIKGLENPDEFIVVSEDDFFSRLTEEV